MFGLDYVYVNLILVSISTALKCGSVEDIGQILLSESYVTCQSLNLKQDRAICEIYSAEDEYNLVCLGLSNCKMPVTLCPDGNINKTCFPLRDDTSLSYQCICHSKRRAEAIVPVTEWTPWTTSTNPYQAFTSERSLIVSSQEWTVLQEFSYFRPTNVYIISHYNLPVSVFSASSSLGGHESNFAHLNYNDRPCAWVGSESKPWLQMTLPTQYVVVGALIQQRCDSPYNNQYATRVKVTTSVDGVNWQTIIESEDVIYDVYHGPGKYSLWFPRAYTNRYWRIQVLNYSQYPSVRADLIGYK